MRIPLSWLKEFLPLSLSSKEIADALTMAGLEVDKVEIVGENLKDIRVVRVIEANKHPNADKLTVATVTDGKEQYSVVCGAPNCRVGLKTAFAPVGVTLTDDQGSFTIKKAKIRGVESFGMLCSEKELGISDHHDTIMDFAEDIPEGISLAEKYADTYFEISLTPNLSHCTSVMGVARELAAITSTQLLLPKIAVSETGDSIQTSLQVKIVESKDCPRYACRVIQDVTVQPSPEWLKVRLEKSGIRSVNNIVDATNYVLLELGHPLHAFDYARLKGQEILVRKAKEGERIQTLDGKERVLKETMLVIADRENPVAIAGVMGGLESEIQPETRHIVLESAYFDPVSIRRTSQAFGLKTDASKRFERGTDPKQVLQALDRAAMLIQDVAGGKILKGVVDISSRAFEEKKVECRLHRVNALIGRAFSRGEVEDIFKRLHFVYEVNGRGDFIVTIPTYRNDIQFEVDLIEEVARLYGYDNIPRMGGQYPYCTLNSNPYYLFEKELRSELMGEGLQEFLTCDLVGPSLLQMIDERALDNPSLIKVMNPTSIEQSILRTSLLPGLLQVIKYNHDHQNHDVAGFEIGRIHFQEGEQYREQNVAAIILTGSTTPYHWDPKPREWDFFDLKGIVENLLKELGISQAVFKNLGLKTFHSGRQASIFVGALEIGSIGEIHPSIQRRLDCSQRILFGEFNLQELIQLVKPVTTVKSLSLYPGSERDWTLTLKDSVPFEHVMELIEKERSPLLEKIGLKDIYRSDKIGVGFQNLTLRFVYRDPSKTIAQETVETEHQRLTTSVLKSLGDLVKN